MDFTLVITTYNRSKEIIRALSSVVRQDVEGREWECVVVDNNSSDDTAEAVNSFISSNKSCNIRYILEQQQGLSAARNAGIKVSKGAIIAFIDDDETITPSFVSSYIYLFDHYKQAMAAGGPVEPVYAEGKPSWISEYTERPIANQMDFGKRIRKFPNRRKPAGGNMAFRREVFEADGVFNTELGRKGEVLSGGEELELFNRVRSAGAEVFYVPGARMYHHIPSSKLTEQYFSELCYQVGRSKYVRAKINGAVDALMRQEVKNRLGTVVLAVLYTLILQPEKGRWLILMRKRILKGIHDAKCSG